MLRITKNAEIFLREKEPHFTSNMRKGVVLALLLHLLFFALFRVAIPSHSERYLPLSPVLVEIDLGLPSQKGEVAEAALSPIEQRPPPRFLDLPHPKLISQIDSPISYPEPDFSEIERMDFEPFLDFEEEEEQR